MKTLVIYDSQYGNTERLAWAIGGVMRERGEVRVMPVSEADTTDFEEADFIAVGGPTQRHGISPNMKKLFENIPDNVARRTPAIAFDTRYHLPAWASGMASDDIADHLHRIGCRLLMPHESFFVEKEEGPLSEGEFERAANWARMTLTRLRLLAPVGSQT